MASLLAVDLGLRCGLATYSEDGRLTGYRSTNFGSIARLKRAMPALLDELPGLAWLVAEGDRHLFELWEREARRRGAGSRLVPASEWRPRLLFPREHRRSRAAKESAGPLARRVIDWSRAPRPTSLRHDAAEAILIGLWGVLEVGWLEALPRELEGGR